MKAIDYDGLIHKDDITKIRISYDTLDFSCPHCKKWIKDDSLKAVVEGLPSRVDGTSQLFKCNVCAGLVRIEVQRPIIYHIVGVKEVEREVNNATPSSN